jgi:hypothetical protein
MAGPLAVIGSGQAKNLPGRGILVGCSNKQGSVLLVSSKDPDNDRREEPAAALRPTEPQRRYLERGLSQPGGKLPLFYADGREVAPRTIQACVANGWAEPWFRNPVKPDWLVCRLTDRGRRVLGHTEPPASPPGNARAPKRRRTKA